MRGGVKLTAESEDTSIGDKVKGMFAMIYKILQELAKEYHIDIKDMYTSEYIRREFLGYHPFSSLGEDKEKARIENSDIMQMCLLYEMLAEKSLEKLSACTEGKRDGKTVRSMEILDWYLDFPQIMMRKALQARYSDKKTLECDGLAKVVLLAIGRSIRNWQKIGELHPSLQVEAGQLSELLRVLRADILQQFPEAPAFKRPGFE